MLNFFIGYFIGNLVFLLVAYIGFSINKKHSSEDVDNF